MCQVHGNLHRVSYSFDGRLEGKRDAMTHFARKLQLWYWTSILRQTCSIAFLFYTQRGILSMCPFKQICFWYFPVAECSDSNARNPVNVDERSWLMPFDQLLADKKTMHSQWIMIMLAASSGKRNATVWCPSVLPSVCPIGILIAIYKRAACDAASVDFGPTTRRTGIIVDAFLTGSHTSFRS